jgi:hypothetical protein
MIRIRCDRFGGVCQTFGVEVLNNAVYSLPKNHTVILGRNYTIALSVFNLSICRQFVGWVLRIQVVGEGGKIDFSLQPCWAGRHTLIHPIILALVGTAAF